MNASVMPYAMALVTPMKKFLQLFLADLVARRDALRSQCACKRAC
jgi:hypothetical protein